MDTHLPLFDWVLAASARASLLTVAVLVTQAVLRHRVAARWRYALWVPVLIVLLVPAFPESPWSVSSIINMPPKPMTVSSVMEPNGVMITHSTHEEALATRVPTSWGQILCLAWLGGAAGLVILGLSAYLQTLSQCQRTRLPASAALRKEIAVLAQEMGLRRVPRVWVASAVHSPAVTGLLRPTLLLPAHFEQTLGPQEMRFVLKHELMHLKRGDLFVHALLCLLLTLHWFNPLLWLAFFKVRLDREAACDAQVLDREDQAGRVAYGHTLLTVETAFNRHGLSLGFVGIFQRGAALRSRIQSIASRPKPHPLMKFTLCLGTVLLTFLGITKAATPDPKAPQILIQTKFVEISGQNTGAAGGTPLPVPLDIAGKKVPGLIATLTDPQFQTVVRGLSQRKGVDLLTAPEIITKASQQAKVEVVRKFTYKDETDKQATKSPGITLTVLPETKGDDQIALDVSSQIVEFEGFVKHKKSGWQEPLFKERKAKVSVVTTSGQTSILEMEPRIDKQIVEDTDGKGRVISTKTELIHRRLFVFVTAYLVEPATGKPRVPKKLALSTIGEGA